MCQVEEKEDPPTSGRKARETSPVELMCSAVIPGRTKLIDAPTPVHAHDRPVRRCTTASYIAVRQAVRIVLLHTKPFQTDLGRLGTVIGVGGFPEPRVRQGLLRRDAVLWVVDEDLAEEIVEVLEKRGVVWNNVLYAVSDDRRGLVGWVPTSRRFMALTNLLDALVVSAVG